MADSYALVNPWRYGIGEEEVARRLGYVYREGDDSPGGWYTQSQNNEGAMQWSRVRSGDNEGGEGTSSLPSFSDAFDPREAQRQTQFLNTVIPTIQNTRSDIWQAYQKAYGDQAASKLYVDLGEGFGGSNVWRDPDSPERQLKQFVSGPFQLFNDAYSKPSHFMVRPGSGYLPMNQEDFSGFAADSLGLFLDENGLPIIGGVASRPAEHGLGAIATMMPVILGSIFAGSALGGAFPGIDVATGSFMPAGTTGIFGAGAGGGVLADPTLGVGGSGGMFPGMTIENLATSLLEGGMTASEVASVLGMTAEELASLGTTAATTGATGASGIPQNILDAYQGLNYTEADIKALMDGTYNGGYIDSSTVVPNVDPNLVNGSYLDMRGKVIQWLADQGVPSEIWQNLSSLPIDQLSKLVGSMGGTGTGGTGGTGGISAPSVGGGSSVGPAQFGGYLPEQVHQAIPRSLGQLLAGR